MNVGIRFIQELQADYVVLILDLPRNPLENRGRVVLVDLVIEEGRFLRVNSRMLCDFKVMNTAPAGLFTTHLPQPFWLPPAP